MKSQLRNEWCDALRSGKYKQCKHVLTNGKAYCCLGVLAKVAGLTELPDNGNDSPRFKTNKGLLLYDAFTEEYLQQLGLREIQQSDLIDLNDNDNKNFSEIADYIEREILCSD